VTAPDYDGVLKDLFQKDHPTLLDRLTGGVGIREVLSTDFQEMQQRRADLVLELEDGSILHIEFQSENDSDMPYRMAIYAVMIGRRYRRPMRQVVLYVGQEKLRMEDHLDLGAFQIRYSLIDIREFDAEELMRSGGPGDLALAVLARGGTEKLFDIARCAAELDPIERSRALSQISLLCGLRKLPEDLRMKVKNMSSLLKDHWLVRELYDEALSKGETKGRVELLRTMLKDKFGPLPVAIEELLARGSSTDLDRWATRSMKVDTLDAVFAND
jgi:hypothetical protein